MLGEKLRSPLASAQLIERMWLKRVFQVTLSETEQHSYNVTYNGRGIGWEGVYVDGEIATLHSSFFWFVYQFEFRIGSHSAVIKVRVWPWLAIRSLRFSVEGKDIYSEGL